MKKYFSLLSIIFFASCHSFGINNTSAEPVPVTIVSSKDADTAKSHNQINFRSMGAGENDYTIKASGNAETTVQYLFVSAKPFSDAASHEIDLVLKDQTGQTIFSSPLPFSDETFSQPVQFFIKQNESLELQSTTDRFTYWASGTQLKSK